MTRNQKLHVLHVDSAQGFAEGQALQYVSGDTLLFDFVYFLHPVWPPPFLAQWYTVREALRSARPLGLNGALCSTLSWECGKTHHDGTSGGEIISHGRCRVVKLLSMMIESLYADSNWALGRDYVPVVLNPEAGGLLCMAASAVCAAASEAGESLLATVLIATICLTLRRTRTAALHNIQICIALWHLLLSQSCHSCHTALLLVWPLKDSTASVVDAICIRRSSSGSLLCHIRVLSGLPGASDGVG